MRGVPKKESVSERTEKGADMPAEAAKAGPDWVRELYEEFDLMRDETLLGIEDEVESDDATPAERKKRHPRRNARLN